MKLILGIKAKGSCKMTCFGLIIAVLALRSGTIWSMEKPYIRAYSMIRADASDKKGPILYDPTALSTEYYENECFFWHNGYWTDPVNPNKFPGYHVSLGAFEITIPGLNDDNAPNYVKNIQDALYNATFEEAKKASLTLNFDIVKPFPKFLSLTISKSNDIFVKLVRDIQNNVSQKLKAILPAGFAIEYLYKEIKPHISLAHLLDTPIIVDASRQKPITGLKPFIFGGPGMRKLSIHATARLAKVPPQPRKFDLLQLVEQALKCSYSSLDNAIDRLSRAQILTNFTQDEIDQALRAATKNNRPKIIEVLKGAMSLRH